MVSLGKTTLSFAFIESNKSISKYIHMKWRNSSTNSEPPVVRELSDNKRSVLFQLLGNKPSTHRKKLFYFVPFEIFRTWNRFESKNFYFHGFLYTCRYVAVWLNNFLLKIVVLRAIVNAPRYITNAMMHSDLGIPTLQDVIHKKATSTEPDYSLIQTHSYSPYQGTIYPGDWNEDGQLTCNQE